MHISQKSAIRWNNSLSISNIVIDSVCIALLISINYIAALIQLDGGIFIPFSIILILQIIKINSFKLNLKTIAIILALSILILMSMMILEEPKHATEYLFKFIAFGVTGLILSNARIDENDVFSLTVIVGFITLPILLSLDNLEPGSESRMGTSYALLPVFFSAVLKMSGSTIYKFMSISIVLIYSYIFVAFASRGVFLPILFFMTIYITKYFVKSKRSHYINYMALLVPSLIILLLYGNIFILETLSSLFSFLTNYDINFYALEKTMYLLNNEELSHGRDFIWSTAIQGILNSPIIGHGVGSFEMQGIGYTHNIFLQVLYETGIMGFLFVFGLFLYVLIKILRSRKGQTNNLIILLFSTSFLSLMLSSTLWFNQSFWLLTGIVVNKSYDFNAMPKTGYTS